MNEPAERGACAECGGSGYVVEQALGRIASARRCGCQTRCPRCGETGYVLVPTGSTSLAQVCPCRHLDQRIATFNAVGIPAAVARASFETFKTWSATQGRARQAAEDFAHKFRTDHPTRGLLLHGKPGCGKTHLLGAALRYLALERGVASRYVEFMLLLSDIRAGFDSNRGHMEILRPLAGIPVLAIDELGKERGTEWERSMLDELISRRYNAGLTTLFATNYPLQLEAAAERLGRHADTRSKDWQREAEAMTLAQRIGDRLISRLNEMCDFYRVDGPDHRTDGAPERGSFWR